MCIRDRYQRRVRGRDHSSMKRPVSLLLLIGACSVRAWFGSNDEWEFREEIEEQYDWLKGSEWFWNGWRNVKLKADGSFWAPSPECEADQAHGCNWSAHSGYIWICLLYTSDAADEEDSVDLGGRRIIKKKKKEKGGEGDGSRS
eukprot:TRINITY_DN18239_c0_g1_i1.p1 TRINITY_DN18239_c0_g1~~TRINITY_DN18239_c0_g1_i1.p1  ORF type:complete len:144 (+),score=41.31 TRINITY_DN18239_c0_g1_i1:87-518(+)